MGLAVSHSKWKDPKDEQPGCWAGSMEALWWYGGISELYIVVNGDATNDRDCLRRADRSGPESTSESSRSYRRYCPFMKDNRGAESENHGRIQIKADQS